MSSDNRRVIARHNLMSLLDGMDGEQIIYICAPAGYGKTVSTRQWLDRSKAKYAFIPLDEYDNNPAIFCSRFCAALRTCQPKNAALDEIVSHPAFDSAPDEFTVRALTALSADKRVALVLDDLHCIDDERMLRLITAFFRRLPENFQIVLISRNELPIGLSDMWLKGRLARVGIDDLRFSQEEIAQLYEKHGHRITQKRAEDIHHFTGGWAIGISALLLSGGNPSGENLKYLEEFIEINVWRRWDEATREAMIKTAVVKDLTPELFTALTGETDGERILKGFVRKNMFISVSANRVYRFHHLFYDFLGRQLEARGAEVLGEQLKKAGKWYLEKEDFYKAVECFIKCGDVDGVAKFFERIITIGRKGFFIESVLPVLDLSIIHQVADRYPYIYALLSWAAFNLGRADSMVEYADRYYANLPKDLQVNPILALNDICLRLIDFRISFYDLIQALTVLSVNLLTSETAGVEALIGTINQNMPLLHRGTRDFSELIMGNIGQRMEEVKLMIGGLFGEETDLLVECLTGGLLYEQGHLEAAHVHALEAIAEIREYFASESKFLAMTISVYILDALGEQDQADQVLERIADMIERDDAYFLDYNFRALAVRRKLGAGDMKAAHGWLDEHGADYYNGLDFYRLYGHFTTGRAYIAVGDYDAAIILLKKALELVTAYNRPLDMIESRILLSIAYWKKKRGFQEEAMCHLERAVLLARDFGYTQMFVNDGAELSGMLHRLQRRAEQQSRKESLPASFVKMLYLKTLDHQGGGLTSGQPAKLMNYTDKQKTVMKLMCEGKSQRETADLMGIKLSTLRSHISLIYKKLDAANETDAIVKIKLLGILEDF